SFDSVDASGNTFNYVLNSTYTISSAGVVSLSQGPTPPAAIDAFGVGFGMYKLSGSFDPTLPISALQAWTNMSSGLRSRDIRSILYVPGASSGAGAFFAGTNGMGVYKSNVSSSPLSWSPANTGLPANAVVSALAADSNLSTANIYA